MLPVVKEKLNVMYKGKQITNSILLNKQVRMGDKRAWIQSILFLNDALSYFICTLTGPRPGTPIYTIYSETTAMLYFIVIARIHCIIFSGFGY